MPVCQNCGKEWTWKQTVKTLFKLKCPHCGANQYESASSRRRGSLVGLTPLVLLGSVN
ncbi:TIGR04104 family putative zinc finger protein [Lentibacillus amyloliquefaciens]|uniref:TIGR04104 family putative zinc finger protein n=1 Tax=Lentibacillus amyloliquefaciens TaxID=1472767 RepID=UPI0009EC1B26|nr:TIGR04104 family putative zinc finger protein [Lentibacillus amyloliquefaciens]